MPPIPPIVIELARTVDMTPIAWSVTAEAVTIVFEQGPKLTFQRDTLASKPAKKSDAKLIDLSDGVDKEEASIAGAALQKRRKNAPPHRE